jgi:hypothetical protein
MTQHTLSLKGHSAVPCEIPAAYTNLYHAHWDDLIRPDSNGLCLTLKWDMGTFGSGRNTHMLTYQSVKPIGCLYFDGMGAALMGTGHLDLQMVFLYDNTTNLSHSEPAGPGAGVLGELRRAERLCHWVQGNDFGWAWMGSRGYGQNERWFRDDLVQLQQS